MNRLRILVVTAMYPHEGNPAYGAFVSGQVEALREKGHRVDVLFVRGFQSRSNYLWSAFSIFARTLRREHDVVHAHHGLCGIPALFRWRTPLVITLHGSDVLVGRVQPFLSRIACFFAARVIAVSRNVAAVIPGTVLPCGVELNIFRPLSKAECRSRLKLDQAQRFILFPFNPARRLKRFDRAELVVHRLRSWGHDAELLVVKEVKHDLLPLYYNAADALLLCSDSEGSPTSVKEALACNVPVVSVDVGDCRSILRDISGAAVCSSSVDELARALDRILRQGVDPRSNGREAMARFDNGRIATALVEEYREAIAARGADVRRD